jgi:hypothetical protein
MGIKLNDAEKFNAPGPGHFNPDHSSVLSAMPKYSMKARNSTTKDEKSPGPGNYEVHLKMKRDAPKYGFGSSKRPALTSNDSPGPGSYKINVKVAETAAFALPNKSEEFKYV